MRSRSRTRAPAVTAAASLLAAITLHAAAGDWQPRARATAGGPLYFRSGVVLQRLALSYDAILADIYWIRAIQYFGRTRLAPGAHKAYDELYPLLDITTTLDPRFTIAYRFGAVFLAEAYPNGPGQPAAAIALLTKGFRADPRRWQYLQDIGFVHYWWRRDFASAARWFERARAVPGAPEWLGPLAAVTLAKGGDRAGSRALWEQLLRTADHEYLRRLAEHRLVQLHVLDELDALNEKLARLRNETGRPPASWAALWARGWIRRNPPVDPAGVPYVVDPRTGRATVSSRSPYYPLPTDSSAGAQPGPGA